MSRNRKQDRKGIDPSWSMSEKQDAAFHGIYFTRDRGAALEIAMLRKEAAARKDRGLALKCGALLALAKPETLAALSETIAYVEANSVIDSKTGALVFDFTKKPMADEKHWIVQGAYYECVNAHQELTVRNVLDRAAQMIDGLDEKAVDRVLKAAALPHIVRAKGRPKKSDIKR